MNINNLSDLNRFRSAPFLTKDQIKKILYEIEEELFKCDWITVGVMADSDIDAKNALTEIINRYKFVGFESFGDLRAQGSVFLKANQKNGIVYIRSENGLGNGILLTCQYNDQLRGSLTYGPFPLKFFSIN
tara:strand:- start:47 stop:439 length:393 start_codon:yes stop_codon:yes gene_type:complete